ncbi:hypothetical protein NYO67_6454 [Aspergillus flavus]|nr:hypothetical protein NYO67_6454 [Aspergillus flavus]
METNLDVDPYADILFDIFIIHGNPSSSNRNRFLKSAPEAPTTYPNRELNKPPWPLLHPSNIHHLMKDSTDTSSMIQRVSKNVLSNPDAFMSLYSPPPITLQPTLPPQPNTAVTPVYLYSPT